MRSVKDAINIPTIMIAAVTRTGLSPLFHFAFFNIGRAGLFFRPPPPLLLLFNQSENNHRSTSLPSPTFGLISTFFLTISSLSASLSKVSKYGSFRPSRYSFTSPSLLDKANLVLLTGTTSFAQTKEATTERKTTTPKPTRIVVSGAIASKDLIFSTGDILVSNSDTSSKEGLSLKILLGSTTLFIMPMLLSLYNTSKFLVLAFGALLTVPVIKLPRYFGFGTKALMIKLFFFRFLLQNTPNWVEC
mmetsp:Transcript_12782/g.28198  ORF Transcript_12782/g.28198 Transcript_12782/m.28198 type:complete len:246 (+) Transcript_12782:106-843(+)